MFREGRGDLYKAPTMEERRKRRTKKRELILDLKDGKLQDSGKQEGKAFHELLSINC